MNCKIIELMFTNACDCGCPSCVVAASQVPDRRMLPWEVLRAWAEQTVPGQYQRIKFFGGEPTLHPDWRKIMSFVRRVNGVDAEYWIHSTVPNLRLPSWVMRPGRRRSETYEPFFDAPVDNPMFDGCEFAGGCWRLEKCGIVLGVDGLLYPCAAGMTVDRVFGLGLGFASLTKLERGLSDYLPQYCRLCGLYANALVRHDPTRFIRGSHVVSRSWEQAFQDWAGADGG